MTPTELEIRSEDLSGTRRNNRYPNMKNATAELKKHEKLIRNLAGRFSKMGVGVEDLAQEGRMALLQALEDWDSTRSALWTYARRRVLGVMIDAVTKETEHHVASSLEFDDDGEVLIPAPGLAVDEACAFSRAFEGLSDHEQELLRLYIVDDLSFDAIEAKLGVDDATIKRRYHAACAKVRAQMGVAA